MGTEEKKQFRYGLIGKDIAYSFSKGYFTQKFKELGLSQSSYENFDLKEIKAFKSLLQNEKQLAGFNVTIPYKEEIMPYLDGLDEEAAQIGAVNTIKFTKDGLKGYNTDVYGFRQSLEPHLKKQHNKALVLGTGGASKAILFVLKKLGIAAQSVSRTPTEHILGYDELNKQIIHEHTLLINATPLGTNPNTAEKPDIPYHYLNEKHLLFDLIYNPPKTAFLLAGEKQGAAIHNGHRMLELQAEKSWEIWTNLE